MPKSDTLPFHDPGGGSMWLPFHVPAHAQLTKYVCFLPSPNTRKWRGTGAKPGAESVTHLRSAHVVRWVHVQSNVTPTCLSASTTFPGLR